MSALTLTQHAIVRMSQRGIRPNDLDLIESIGTEVEGGYSSGKRIFRLSNAS